MPTWKPDPTAALSVTCPLGTQAGLFLGWWFLAESSECLQTSLGAFNKRP